MTVRIIFMGTPEFAVPALQKLNEHYTVVAVVTQPDRPQGRNRKLIAPPVKKAAQSMGLPVLQPPTLKDPTAIAALKDLRPNLIVVAAFGQILRADVLTMPPLGCINIHASLLPRWRGAAPVAAAIRAGDTETGVTLMLMDQGLDTGPILRAKAIPIQPTHTRETLTAELAHLGANLLVDTLPHWLAHSITPQLQDSAQATIAPRLKKEAGRINWQQSAVTIERHIRAFTPWPSAFTYWEDTRIKIFPAGVAKNAPIQLQPGQVFKLGAQVAVRTGQGAILLQKIQPAGKRLMPVTDFVRGASRFIGAQLL